MSGLDRAIQIESSSPAQVMQSFHSTQAIAQLRTQYLNEVLRQQIASGCKQVVTLGAGIDVFADRLTTPNVRYFEIGQATIGQHQPAQVSSNHDQPNTTYIAENYLQPHLIEILQQHQFNVQLPTYFVWTGSVPLLKRGDIIAVIDILRDHIFQFHLSFDYLSGLQTLDRLDYVDINQLTVFKDIAVFVKALGLELLETCTIDQLYDRYSPQSPCPATPLDFYCICTIAKRLLNW